MFGQFGNSVFFFGAGHSRRRVAHIQEQNMGTALVSGCVLCAFVWFASFFLFASFVHHSPCVCCFVVVFVRFLADMLVSDVVGMKEVYAFMRRLLEQRYSNMKHHFPVRFSLSCFALVFHNFGGVLAAFAGCFDMVPSTIGCICCSHRRIGRKSAR